LPVRIVTDSTSDFPPQLASELNVSIVPLSVIFGDEVLQDGRDINHEQFYERLVRSKVTPTTSAPSVGDFLEVYEPLLKDSHEILSVHLSSKLSATYNNACQAARQLSEQGATIEVIDSETVSFGMTFLAAAAARAAMNGAGLEEVKQLVTGMMSRVKILIALDTLEYLRRGGRIGRARAFLGAVMRVKPLLSIRDGEVHPEERVRTKKLAIERLFQIVTSYRAQEVAVGYTTNEQEAEELRLRLVEAMPGITTHLQRLGPVLGVHGGPGVLGVGVLEGE
jgi:DegV family protein with EDD domain